MGSQVHVALVEFYGWYMARWLSIGFLSVGICFATGVSCFPLFHKLCAQHGTSEGHDVQGHWCLFQHRIS